MGPCAIRVYKMCDYLFESVIKNTIAARNEIAQIAKFDGSNFQAGKFSVSIILLAGKLM